MSIVDLLSIPRVADPQLSPDGSAVVYTKGDADWKSGKRISHIWRVRVDASTPPIQLTNGTDGENDPHWSPDGRNDRLHRQARRRRVRADLTCCRPTAAKSRRLTTHASAVSDITWAPDGSALYFSAPEAKTADEKARDKNKRRRLRLRRELQADAPLEGDGWNRGAGQRGPCGACPGAGAPGVIEESRISSGDYSVTSYRAVRRWEEDRVPSRADAAARIGRRTAKSG